jgi:hypothetical protein
MSLQSTEELERGELDRALGRLGSITILSDPSGPGKRLIDYVFDPMRRTAVSSYEAIRDHFDQHWSVTCVEIDSEVRESLPFSAPRDDLGCFSVRMLFAIRESELYLAIRGDLRNCNKTVALLHEIGHLAFHFPLLQSIGTLYHRISMDPRLEFEIGGYLRSSAGTEMISILELEADLFAVSWLVPITYDEERLSNGNQEGSESRLTGDGLRYLLLRRCFDHGTDGKIHAAKIPGYNHLGEELRRTTEGAYPLHGSLWERLSWVLCQRDELLSPSCNKQRQESMRQCLELFGFSPRRIPEMAGKRHPILRDQTNEDQAWIPRRTPEELESAVDLHHWEPFLVPPKGKSVPAYHIPITPVPNREKRDSKVEWRHVGKADSAMPAALSHWRRAAEDQQAGLLVFPRNPAERMLDEMRVIR